MRTKALKRKPTCVYYIYDMDKEYVGPYAKKPSEKMLENCFGKKVVKFTLVEFK